MGKSTDRQKLVPMRQAPDVPPHLARSATALDKQPGRPLIAINIGEIGKTIRQGKWLIFYSILSAVVLLFAYEFTKDPVFRASSQVSIKPPTMAESKNILTSFSNPHPTQGQELAFLKNSGELARRVGMRLQETSETMRSSELFPVLAPDQNGTQPSPDLIGQRILSKVKFAPLGNEGISISLISISPVEAVRLAELYAKEYQKIEYERSIQRINTSKKFLNEQLDSRRKQLAELEDQWIRTMGSSAGRLVTGGTEKQIARYAFLKTNLEKVQLKLDEEFKHNEIMLAEFKRLSPVDVQQSGIVYPGTPWKDNLRKLVRAQLEIDLFALEQNQSRLADRQSSEYRVAQEQLKIYQDEWEARNRRILALVLSSEIENTELPDKGRYLNQLRIDVTERNLRIAEYEILIEGLRGYLEETETELNRNPGQRLELSQLEKERAVVESWYKNIQRDIRLFELAEQSEIGHITLTNDIPAPVIERADLSQNLLIVLGMSFVFGIGLAFVRRAFVNKRSIVEYY